MSLPAVPPDTLFAFYAASLRAPLFTGFLTLAGFLLAATTFIVLQMKKELYEKGYYAGRVSRGKAFGGTGAVYAPLRRLGHVLMACVSLALLSSVSQLTIGLIESSITACICIALATLAVLGLSWSIYLVWGNLNTLFREWEKQAATSS